MSRDDPGAEGRALELLRLWEAGDPETVALWKTMNSWAVEGMKETYARTGVSFDQYYFESGTYLLGREEILKGLEQGVFYREADGSVQVDLTGKNLTRRSSSAKTVRRFILPRISAPLLRATRTGLLTGWSMW